VQLLATHLSKFGRAVYFGEQLAGGNVHWW